MAGNRASHLDVMEGGASANGDLGGRVGLVELVVGVDLNLLHTSLFMELYVHQVRLRPVRPTAETDTP